MRADGETRAAAVFAAVQSRSEAARQLAYRLYTLCERKNWSEDPRAYNEVVTSWSGIESVQPKSPQQRNARCLNRFTTIVSFHEQFNGWTKAEDARAYNEVVTSWFGIESVAAKEPTMKQGERF